MKKIFYSIMVLATVFILFACGLETADEFELIETPQTYVLQDEDPMMIMPTIVLYENKNAQLSQPPISSFGLFSMGQYEIKEKELIITHNENISASFEVSDHGKTLTLKSSSLGFTKVGAVYKYQPKIDYLSQYETFEGEILTIDRLRELVKNAPNLSLSDFEKYTHFYINEDHYIFDVDKEYTLEVTEINEENTHCIIERNLDGEGFPLNFNGSTHYVFDEYLGLVSPLKYQAQEWFDYFNHDELPRQASKELTLTEFPEVTFTWTSEQLTAGDKVIFEGMPIWNIFLADLTNDGKPEFCATISLGSGIIDHRILVYDYAADKLYQLSDRMKYDYSLSMVDGQIMVTQTAYGDEKNLALVELQLIKGEIFNFGQ